LSLNSLLETVVEVLEECGIPYMLTGSIAGAYYALPRATQDVDLVVDPGPDQLDSLVQLLRDRGLYVSETAAAEALRDKGKFNAVDPTAGWKVDLIIRKDRSFSVLEFSRRRSGTVTGLEVALTSLEDLILAKLEWADMGHSDLQRQDVLQLTESGWDDIDRAYIDHWARAVGIEGEWTRILVQVTASRQGDAD
jgi:hypothetical protein